MRRTLSALCGKWYEETLIKMIPFSCEQMFVIRLHDKSTIWWLSLTRFSTELLRAFWIGDLRGRHDLTRLRGLKQSYIMHLKPELSLYIRYSPVHKISHSTSPIGTRPYITYQYRHMDSSRSERSRSTSSNSLPLGLPRLRKCRRRNIFLPPRSP